MRAKWNGVLASNAGSKGPRPSVHASSSICQKKKHVSLRFLVSRGDIKEYIEIRYYIHHIRIQNIQTNIHRIGANHIKLKHGKRE